MSFPIFLPAVSLKRPLAASMVLLSASLLPLPASAADLRLFGDISLNDSTEHVQSLPGVFDCSALYDDKTAYCFDQLQELNVDEGMLAVFPVEQKVRYVEYSATLTAANYNAILAGVRRKGLVFTHLSVNGEELDVLAGIRSLDRQTLDDQMFALANRYDFTVPREYLFLDKRAFNHAYRKGYRDVEHYLAAEPAEDRQKAEARMVKMSVTREQIILTISYPFADSGE